MKMIVPQVVPLEKMKVKKSSKIFKRRWHNNKTL